MYEQIAANKRRTSFLILIFCGFIISVGWLLNQYYGLGYEAVVLSVIISTTMSLGSYYFSDQIALKSSGAIKIEKNDNPYVYRMVENLSIASGLPMPQVYIIESQALNAFATGRDPKHASIAITTGLISALENEELEGVIAHELSHIKNYDIRVMTIVVVLIGVISLLADFFLRFGLGRRDNENRASGPIAIVGLILLILSPIAAELIKLAVSRKREYLADASGALITRYPEGLARALEKISHSNIPFDKANTATAHLFINNPFKGKKISGFFSTHPPAEDRIKKLREMGA